VIQGKHSLISTIYFYEITTATNSWLPFFHMVGWKSILIEFQIPSMCLTSVVQLAWKIVQLHQKLNVWVHIILGCIMSRELIHDTLQVCYKTTLDNNIVYEINW